jgi:proline iminopeptidase
MMNRKKYTRAYLITLLLALSWTISYTQLKEGQFYAETSGGTVWYHVIGESDTTPLLILHGGPGGTIYSLYPLAFLSNEYQLIFFDQIGGGRSDIISDTSLMTLDYFVDQLKEFIDVLGLNSFYLYGHSWGTMLGLEYYLKYPEGIKALIFNSPLVSTELWEKDADVLIATLPDSIGRAIELHEKSKTFDSPEYQYANQIYYKNFIRRKAYINTPFDVERVSGNNKIYNYMWGPSEFTATGTLKQYNRLADLARIDIPTLFITGEFDEARPETVKYYHSLVKGSSFQIIEDAAHATMHDNPDENIKIIREYLRKLEN